MFWKGKKPKHIQKTALNFEQWLCDLPGKQGHIELTNTKKAALSSSFLFIFSRDPIPVN
jgi:hypothetical protein